MCSQLSSSFLNHENSSSLGSYDPSAGGMFEFVSNILAYSNYVIAPISDEFINADNPRIIVKYYGPHNYRYCPSLLRTLEQISPDIIHCHGLWMDFCRVVLSMSIKIHLAYIVSPHGMLDSIALRQSSFLKLLMVVFTTSSYIMLLHSTLYAKRKLIN